MIHKIKFLIIKSKKLNKKKSYLLRENRDFTPSLAFYSLFLSFILNFTDLKRKIKVVDASKKIFFLQFFDA